MQDYYLIKYNNQLFSYPCKVNQRGFTYEEAIQTANRNKWRNYTLVSIDKEIEKYNLHGNLEHRDLMPPEVFVYETWLNAYLDNNINGLSLPIAVDTNETYVEQLKIVYDKYCNEISKPAFIYEDGLADEVRDTCNQIIDILFLLIAGQREKATIELGKIIEPFVENPFLVSELDKSYSFRGIAPFIDLRNCSYEYQKMIDKNLSFFRVRTKRKENTDSISEKEHIVHLPYGMRGMASTMRFSREGVPCLYLGTTSFVCCNECGWDSENEDMFSAAFVPNEQGKKLRILNLTISQALINGIYNRGIDGDSEVRKTLQLSMIKIFPLVIATSFSIAQDKREKRYEYLISQALMEIIRELKIDGIAYLSMKGKDEFQYPYGVNLALPAFDISEEKHFSKYCEAFDMTDPVKFEYQTSRSHKSYIN